MPDNRTDEERWTSWLRAGSPGLMWQQALGLRLSYRRVDWGAVFARLSAHPLPAWDYSVRQFIINTKGCLLTPKDPAALQRLVCRVLAQGGADPEQVFNFLNMDVARNDHPSAQQWKEEILPIAPQYLPVALQLFDPEKPWPGSRTHVWRTQLGGLLGLAQAQPQEVWRAVDFLLSTGLPVRGDSPRFMADIASLLYAMPHANGSLVLHKVGSRFTRSTSSERKKQGWFFMSVHLYDDPLAAFVETFLPDMGPARGMADVFGVNTWPGDAQRQWWQEQVDAVWRLKQSADATDRSPKIQ